MYTVCANVHSKGHRLTRFAPRYGCIYALNLLSFLLFLLMLQLRCCCSFDARYVVLLSGSGTCTLVTIGLCLVYVVTMCGPVMR